MQSVNPLARPDARQMCAKTALHPQCMQVVDPLARPDARQMCANITLHSGVYTHGSVHVYIEIVSDRDACKEIHTFGLKMHMSNTCPVLQSKQKHSQQI